MIAGTCKSIDINLHLQCLKEDRVDILLVSSLVPSDATGVVRIRISCCLEMSNLKVSNAILEYIQLLAEIGSQCNHQESLLYGLVYVFW